MNKYYDIIISYLFQTKFCDYAIEDLTVTRE